MVNPHKIIDVQLFGSKKNMANLTAYIERAKDKVAEAYYDEMFDVMMESQAECPWDYTNDHNDGSPHLRDTARVDQEFANDELVTYGSYATPYAVYVHEILEYHHIPPTKAKFLEDPVNRRAKVLVKNILTRIGNMYEGITEPLPFTKTASITRDFNKYLAARGEAIKAKAVSRLGHLGGRFI